MYCKTCKYWDKKSVYRGESLDVGCCTAVKPFWDALDGYFDAKTTEVFERYSAFAQDGSDYKAYLITKAEHYCSMYEEADGLSKES